MKPINPTQTSIRQAARTIHYLPPICKQIFIHYYIQSKPLEEIASDLHLTKHKARNILGKTTRLMRTYNKKFTEE